MFYVPNWIRDTHDEKAKNAYKNLIQSIKELVYADSTVDIKEIYALVDARKIDLGVENNLSTNFYGYAKKRYFA